jgi:hypothetical protein
MDNRNENITNYVISNGVSIFSRRLRIKNFFQLHVKIS